MSDKYTLNPPDLRHFPATPQTLDAFFLHHTHPTTRGFSPSSSSPPPPKFQPLQPAPANDHHGLLQFVCSDIPTPTPAAAPPSFLRRGNRVVEYSEELWYPYNGNDVVVGGSSNNSRWPRQETLTLLEIRSRLDSKFKESNQKAPLWDQLSRMMAEEYGYKRSGKKCKEKFDNLYKYYKKTKEGKTGRHDGKHYRFFRQLEAIYGECNDQQQQQLSSPAIESNFSPVGKFSASEPSNHHNNNNDDQKASGLSFSISSDFETSSSGNYQGDELSAIAFMMNRRTTAERARENEYMTSKGEGRRRSWREEVEKMVDSKLSRLMEVQENWMEKIMASVEDGERERLVKEEEWRKQEMARFDREMNEFCARERSWLQARDDALMEIVKKFAGKGYH